MSYVDVATSSRHILIRRASGLPLGGGGTAPVNTVLPAITGTPTVDQTLTSSTGTWTNSPTSYAYQWKRAGVAIGGATASTYLLVSADTATLITVTVTATNASGSASATSASVGPIAAAVVGGAALLVGETDGFATDFTYTTDANRVAVKTAGTLVSSGLDAFFQNAGTSPKQVFDISGNLVWAPHNMILQSEDFTNASWTLGLTPITTAHTIQDDNAAGSEYIQQTITLIVGQSYTYSLWVLKDAVTTRCPMFQVISTASYQLVLDTSTGASNVLTNTFTSASSAVEDVVTHWKVKITFVAQIATSSTRIFPAYTLTVGAATSIAAVGSITVDKVQWNRGTVPTEYLTTTSAARYGLAIDYDPVTHAPLGLLCEPAATNILLNNATLSTQSVAVAAQSYVLSFWGTGTVTLSGVSTAGPLVGTGASNRVSLTFTPTAGSLTCTVTGTVSRAQLETGALLGTSPSSPIPTFAASATRGVDQYSTTSASIPLSGTAGSWWADVDIRFGTSGGRIVCGTSGAPPAAPLTTTNVNNFGLIEGTTLNKAVTTAGRHKIASAFTTGDRALTADGLTVAPDAGATTNLLAPGVTTFFGAQTAGGTPSNCYIRQIRYVPRRKSNAELVTETA